MSRTYLLKIYKPGTKVYRQAWVPGHVTLDELHRAIHEWMEFPTYEMYGFFPNNKLLSESGYYAPQMQKRPADKVRLDQLRLHKDQRILYVYDMQELMQFYIYVEDIEERELPEIRLIRRNGHLTFKEPQKVEEVPLPEDPDTWHVYMRDIEMQECILSNPPELLLDTAHAMNIRVQKNWTPEDIAAAIVEALETDETLIIRMMPMHMMQVVHDLWETPDGDIALYSYDLLVRMSLLGFLLLDESEEDRVIECSSFTQEWLSSVLNQREKLRAVEMYSRWSAAARGLLYTYGVIQMDDFYTMFLNCIDEKPDIDEVCDFMMQRMEWNTECHAIQDQEELYWSVPEPEKADMILQKRKKMPLDYKPLSKKEIIENSETAGWQNVDRGQELFGALQGMALETDEIRDLLFVIVQDFAHGMEPHEIMKDCIDPVNTVGRTAETKIRMLLRDIKRQLPDYGYMGYSIEEIEQKHPEYRVVEGIQILRGGKN